MNPPAIRTVLAEAAGSLATRSETPRLDAELLLSHAMGVSRAALLARLADPVEDRSTLEQFARLVRRRLAGEPVAYILEEVDFYGLAVRTRRPVLVPRPETELLVEAALEYLERRGMGPFRLLDLCTGSGCVALAIRHHRPDVACVGVDISPAAIALARENADRLNLEITLLTGDLFDASGLRDLAPFQAIVANPPYVAFSEWAGLPPDVRCHEDPGALLGGADGLDVVRRIVKEAPGWLASGGLLALELGEGQFSAVREMAEASGLTAVQAIRDLAGTNRILTALKS